MASGQSSGKSSNGVVATTQSYVRDFIKLYSNSSNEEFTDIQSLVNRIIFTENIRQASVMCTIDILDGVNLFETFKLSGGEKVEIQLSQNTPFGKNILSRTFYVSDIINHTKPSTGYETYQLICITEYAFLNNLIKLDRDFSIRTFNFSSLCSIEKGYGGSYIFLASSFVGSFISLPKYLL